LDDQSDRLSEFAYTDSPAASVSQSLVFARESHHVHRIAASLNAYLTRFGDKPCCVDDTARYIYCVPIKRRLGMLTRLRTTAMMTADKAEIKMDDLVEQGMRVQCEERLCVCLSVRFD
jgi:hypothetical protein